jgi:hypothetical protein
MERLPYIDQHSIVIGATRARVWDVLAAALRADLGGATPKLFARALQLQPAKLHGDWRVTAHTSAAFPGLAGRAYRALVIGTGGHRIVVKQLLRAVARRA